MSSKRQNKNKSIQLYEIIKIIQNKNGMIPNYLLSSNIYYKTCFIKHQSLVSSIQMSQNPQHQSFSLSKLIQPFKINQLPQTLRSFALLPLRFIKYFSSISKNFYNKYPKSSILLAVMSSIVLGGCWFLYRHQQSLLYFPKVGYGKENANNPRHLQHPRNRNIQCDQLQIKTQDNVTLRGWHLKKPGSTQIFVYFHGNAGNIGTRLPFAQQLMQHTNSDVVLVGYRGYSDSDGVPSQEGLEKDSEAIVSKALEISQDRPVYIFGTSLGGAVSIYVGGLQAIRQRISGLIIQNTFTSTSSVLYLISPMLLRVFYPLIKLLNRNQWNSLSRIKKLKSPIMFIKCGRDQIIPPVMTDQLLEQCNKFHLRNFLFEIPEGRHNDVHIIDPKRYFAQVNEFIAQTQRRR